MAIQAHNHEWYCDQYREYDEAEHSFVEAGEQDVPVTVPKKVSYCTVLRCLDEDCSAARKRENDKMGSVYDHDA